MEADRFEELRRGLRGDDDRAERHPPGIPLRHLIGGAGAAMVLAVAVILFTAIRPAGEETGLPVRGAALEPITTATSTTPAATRVWPAEPVEVDGNEVRAAGRRWVVGAPGDLVTVGDWDCDGTATPAVLRPSSGRLHVFDTWAPDATTPVTAAPGPTVPPSASAVEANGCGTATVRTADGRAVRITTQRAGR